MIKPKTIVVSAGDPSGDLLLSKVLENLTQIAEAHSVTLKFKGMAGPHSKKSGLESVANPKDVAVVGLLEVVKKLPSLFRILALLGKQLSGADLVISVDFPDFNFRLAEIAKKLGIPVAHIIAPQVWAWRSSRVTQLPGLLSSLYPALPFEEELFSRAGLYSRYFGHPLRDVLSPKNRREARELFSAQPETKLWALLPGSRRNEIKQHYPLYIEALAEVYKLSEKYFRFPQKLKQTRAIVGLAPGWNEAELDKFLNSKQAQLKNKFKESGFLTFTEHTHKLMMAADWGWVASGTATLESAYYGMPHILVYKLSRISAFLIKSLSNYFSKKDSFVGLPNILLEKAVIPELLQRDLTPRRLALESIEILENEAALSQIKKDLRYLPAKMGESGVSVRIAEDIFMRHLKPQKN